MQKKKLYIETYGCQMNFSDSEIVTSILQEDEYESTANAADADLILVNTCSIRDNAEKRVHARLRELKKYKKTNPGVRIGVIGCMAERLKEQLLEKQEFVDIIAGPDAYRDLPGLLSVAESGQKAINVILSQDETYGDIVPVRYDSNGVSAFISIMRGCENFCSYCVVPYTRGRERSRDPHTIVQEAGDLFAKGYREVTLLGQNVNSYKWDDGTGFAELLERVALVNPLLRVRFATSHPKDISDELLETIARHENIARCIHLPVQSGSNVVLKRMNRKYTREWYMDRVEAIRRIIPGCSITTDIIAGFSGETEQDHHETLSLMQWVPFDYSFMFKYSERPDTLAARKYADDIPDEVKSRRLEEIIALQQKLSLESNRADVGKTFEVLAEGISKKSKEQLFGRNSQNKVIVFNKAGFKPGDYVQVEVTGCTAATLKGKVVEF